MDRRFEVVRRGNMVTCEGSIWSTHDDQATAVAAGTSAGQQHRPVQVLVHRWDGVVEAAHRIVA